MALLLKGYRPLAWRVSIGGGEIDLIVRRGDVVAFVEVKARPTLEEASMASTPASANVLPRRPGLDRPGAVERRHHT